MGTMGANNDLAKLPKPREIPQNLYSGGDGQSTIMNAAVANEDGSGQPNG